MIKKIPKRVKDVIKPAFIGFVVQGGQSFYSLKGSGFIQLAKELFIVDRFLS